MQNNKTSGFDVLKERDPDGFRAMSARGGLMRAALHGRDTNTAKARAAKHAKMLALVNPEGTLSPEEIEVRLHDLRRARAAKMREAKRAKGRDRVLARARERLAKLQEEVNRLEASQHEAADRDAPS